MMPVIHRPRLQDKIKFAVLCSSNMNRSMEAHMFLSKKGFKVESFGTGDKVRLPGLSWDTPNVYDFGTTYESILQDLVGKDKQLYTQTGVLHLLERNKRLKEKPQRFQDSELKFDVIITCEERVYDQTIEFLVVNGTHPVETNPVYVVNIDIEDNHEEATVGSFLIHELATMLCSAEDLDNEIDEILLEFEGRSGRKVLHCIHFY